MSKLNAVILFVEQLYMKLLKERRGPENLDPWMIAKSFSFYQQLNSRIKDLILRLIAHEL